MFTSKHHNLIRLTTSPSYNLHYWFTCWTHSVCLFTYAGDMTISIAISNHLEGAWRTTDIFQITRFSRLFVFCPNADKCTKSVLTQTVARPRFMASKQKNDFQTGPVMWNIWALAPNLSSGDLHTQNTTYSPSNVSISGNSVVDRSIVYHWLQSTVQIWKTTGHLLQVSIWSPIIFSVYTIWKILFLISVYKRSILTSVWVTGSVNSTAFWMQSAILK